MCRIAAYQGPSVPLENIVTRPVHSLLRQSVDACESKTIVNGDGFGIAWYGKDSRPGLYRDVYPAWGDENLSELCRMVRSSLFVAHVRASTGGQTSRANCHPFVHENWSFCHNGQVPHIAGLRRNMEADLPDDLFAARKGTTDSETLFLSLLASGLQKDPARAFDQLFTRLYPITVAAPLRLTCVLSDGASLYALRHASDEWAPSLYVSEQLDNGGWALCSEPLCETEGRWKPVPPDCLIRFQHGRSDILWKGAPRQAA